MTRKENPVPSSKDAATSCHVYLAIGQGQRPPHLLFCQEQHVLSSSQDLSTPFCPRIQKQRSRRPGKTVLCALLKGVKCTLGSAE